ncbi:MAG TPA: DUF4389 domain-containing protein [Nocardioides sp.]|nr:DUF4389 domain-containing protein [Nocardioides sp.]
MSTINYPVHVEAELDPGLSRWLWLVKWVLVIPHYVVLAFLWVAFAVTSVMAFFGILVTGRYPRALFDFNVGVLRWSWRVAYYAYGALGTDRYPPFTLRDVPDYPAHLEIDYPEHLSRGLVLVKWWLLAIPHYLVLAFFLGGAGYAVRSWDSGPAWGSGLIGLMVCVAAVVLLVTGTYPQRVFDLVLGLNRWVLRVAGYVALMTDRYPPFALDQGGHEDAGVATFTGTPPTGPSATAPTTTTAGEPTTPSTPTTSTTPPRTGRGTARGWTGGRVTSLIIGSVAALAALALLVSAAVVGVAAAVGQDRSGFLMSPTESLAGSGYAITSRDLVLRSDTPSLPHRLLGDAKIRVTPAGGKAVFVGIAPSWAVHRYLGHARISVLQRFEGGDPVYAQRGSGTLAMTPGQASIWAEQVTATGPRSLVWPVRTGRWTVVVMNADGSPGVRADASIGAELPVLPWVVAGLLVSGLLVAVAALVLILVPARRVGADHRADTPPPALKAPQDPQGSQAPQA